MRFGGASAEVVFSQIFRGFSHVTSHLIAMTRAQLRCLWPRSYPRSQSVRWNSTSPIVKLDQATFYRRYPSETIDADSPPNPPIFPKLSFSLPSKDEYWSIVSPASLARTTFLQVLNGQYICVPPTARSYPYLASDDIKEARLRSPQNAINYVGFDAERGGIGGASLKGAYLSARYEARKEETDWSLQDYLEGNTELNALEKGVDDLDRSLLERVVKNLRLQELLDRPVSNLSNGQTRRARIAKSLLSRPELLLLDGPFMGLDPQTVAMISRLLQDMAKKSAPRLVLSLRPEDHVPEWISHLVYIDSSLSVLAQGPKEHVFEAITSAEGENTKDGEAIAKKTQHITPPAKRGRVADVIGNPLTRDGFPQHDPSQRSGEAVVEMQGVKVSYGSQDDKAFSTVLGGWSQKIAGEQVEGLHWNVHRGQRWGIFGPNGSGKTTLLSLITSDHPQTYSLPIRLFGKSRLPAPGEPGISLFELQARMGHSSPEVHTFFPKNLTVRRVLESAWADAPMSKPKLTHQADRRVDACLRWFAAELSPNGKSELDEVIATLQANEFKTRPRPANAKEAKTRIERLSRNSDDLDWADTLRFRDLSFSSQRLALFLRAIVAQPDLIILDEAFSGIDEAIRDKCLRFLSHGEQKIAGVRNVEKDGKSTLRDSPIAMYGEVVFEGLNDQQALLVISHSKEDVPGCVREWICLPEPGEGKPARWGSLEGPLELNTHGWDEIWGTSR